MYSIRVVLFAFLGSCVLLATTDPIGLKDKARVVDTEQMVFASGGTIELQDSFGQVSVEGWDRPEVELTVIKTTHKAYSSDEMPRAIAELDRILVGTERPSDNHLIISTVFPDRSVRRLLRGKSNVQMEYHIRAPRRIRLIVRHDIGEVDVSGIIGDIRVTARVGDISLRLPAEVRYAVNAKARIGDVCSDWGASEREHLIGSKATQSSDLPAYELYLRVGVGDISVCKLAEEAETMVD
jgi:hypothetical protein